jgi:hypothetical protein
VSFALNLLRIEVELDQANLKEVTVDPELLDRTDLPEA